MMEPSQNLQVAAEALAAYIDKCAGDYPFVSVTPTNGGPVVAWQYCGCDLSIHIGLPIKLPSTYGMNGGDLTPDIQVSSVEDALLLVKMTESIRQATERPFVILGTM